MSYTATPIETLSINTIRTLAMDAVQAANSGHPGTPMALAPAAYVIFNETMRYDPDQPLWPDRDRFVLSCGHASMLLYSTLHLSGVKQVDAAGRVTDQLAVPLEDIRRFRQLDSRCPGHPEHGPPPAWKRQPGLWARASATASAWPSPSAGWRRSSTGPASICSTTTSMLCAATAT